MTCAGFVILLCSCTLFLCEGAITSPAGEGTEFVFLPGSTANLTWTFDDDVSALIIRAWFFTRSGGSTSERLATIFRDNNPLEEQSSLSGVKIIKPATLLLKNVNQSYDGVYKFELVGSGPTVSNDVKVIIAKKPTATVNCSSSITLNEGDDVTCVCRGEGGNPPANVTWFKDGVQTGETKKLNSTLILSNVNETANGTYKCEARSHTNVSFKDEKSIKLGVRSNFKPIIKSFTSEPDAPINGKEVTLTCESDGLPEPDYMIKFENGSEASATKTYHISVVESRYEGNYTCIAKNIKGNDSAILNLTVQVSTISNGTNGRTNWSIVVVILVSGIIIVLFLAFVIWYLHRRQVVRNRNPEGDPEPQATDSPTYQELDLSKMNTEDNYESLRVNAATNQNDSTYTTLSKTRDEEHTYQSLT